MLILACLHIFVPLLHYNCSVLKRDFYPRYITYSKEEVAVRCIQSVHGFTLDGRSLRWEMATFKIYVLFCILLCRCRDFILQGMLWNHKVLSCLVEKCGMISELLIGNWTIGYR